MRYPNPHMQQQQQQWGGQQQPMTPQQMAIYQQQMAQQQQMMQQQMMQQQMMNPQFQQQMQQQQMYNPQGYQPHMNQGGQYVPQQQMSNQPTNRFGNQGQGQQASVPQGTFQGQKFNTDSGSDRATSDRFGSTVQQEVNVTQEVNQPVVLTGPMAFTVNREGYKFPRNDKVTISPRILTITEKNITVDNEVLITEDPSSPLGTFLDDETRSKKGLTDINLFVKEYYLCQFESKGKAEFKNMFKDGSVKLYTSLKKTFKEEESVDHLIWLDKVNTFLTDRLNKFLDIEFYRYGISISSFVEDYGSLMKAIRTMDDEEFSYETSIKDYMDDLTSILDEGFNNIVVPDVVEDEPVFFRKINSVVLEDTSYSLGIKGIDEIVRLTNNKDNTTLLTMTAIICEYMDTDEFTLYTLDGEVYEFYVNSKGEVFVEKA